MVKKLRRVGALGAALMIGASVLTLAPAPHAAQAAEFPEKPSIDSFKTDDFGPVTTPRGAAKATLVSGNSGTDMYQIVRINEDSGFSFMNDASETPYLLGPESIDSIWAVRQIDGVYAEAEIDPNNPLLEYEQHTEGGRKSEGQDSSFLQIPRAANPLGFNADGSRINFNHNGDYLGFVVNATPNPAWDGKRPPGGLTTFTNKTLRASAVLKSAPVRVEYRDIDTGAEIVPGYYESGIADFNGRSGRDSKFTVSPNREIPLEYSYARTDFNGAQVGSGSNGETVAGKITENEQTVVYWYQVPKLSITKISDATADTRVGDTVNYTVTATNTTEAPFTDAIPAVIVDDLGGVLDDAKYNDDATVSTGEGKVSFASPLLSWSGPLAARQSVSLTYSATLTATGDGVVRNTAWQPKDPANPKTPVCDPAGNGVDAQTGEQCATTETPLPRLTVTKATDRAEVPAAGEEVTYTVTVKNEGPGAFTTNKPATMTDDLSKVLGSATFTGEATATTGSVVFAEPALNWSGALAAGESAEISYTVVYTGAAEGELKNVACVPAELTLPGADSCASTETPGAKLAQWKTVSSNQSPVRAGSVLTYTLHFENTGKASATVDSVDDLSHVTDDARVSAEPKADEGLAVVRDGNRMAVTGTVAAGKTATVTYEVTVLPDGKRGDDTAVNFLVLNDRENPPVTPTDPVCEAAEGKRPSCTTTPIEVIPPVDEHVPGQPTSKAAAKSPLAQTGLGIPAIVAGGVLSALLLVGGTVLIVRSRKGTLG